MTSNPSPRVNDVSTIAVIYSRVSGDAQRDKGTSLDSQEDGARKLCAAEGLTVLAAYRETHTGSEMDRPVFQAALDLLRQRKAGVLVVHALDRFMRDQDGNIVALYEIERRIGARVVSVTERLGNSAEDKLLRGILAWKAENERTTIIERTQRGLRRRAENGKPLAATTPIYGYNWNDDKTAHVVDPITAPIARRIFADVASGQTTRAIRLALDAEGIPTPSQARESHTKRHIAAHWNHSTILRIIKNPAYKGEGEAYRWQSVTKEKLDPHTGYLKKFVTVVMNDGERTLRIPLPVSSVPALVSAAEWQAANHRLGINKQEAGRNTVHPKDQLLRAGLAVCGYCGRNAIVKYVGKNGTKGSVYSCSGQKERPYSECAGNHPSASVHLVDADVWEKVSQMLQHDGLMAALIRRTLRSMEERDTSGEDRLREQVASFDGTMDQLRKRRTNLIRMQAGADDEELYSELDAQVKAATAQIASLAAKRADAQERLDMVQSVTALEPMLALIPGGISAHGTVDLGPDGPKPGTPAFEAALQAHAIRSIHDAWEQATRNPALEAKRAILYFLGTRVELYRQMDKQPPDGKHWQLLFNLDGVREEAARMQAETQAQAQAAQGETTGTSHVSLWGWNSRSDDSGPRSRRARISRGRCAAGLHRRRVGRGPSCRRRGTWDAAPRHRTRTTPSPTRRTAA